MGKEPLPGEDTPKCRESAPFPRCALCCQISSLPMHPASRNASPSTTMLHTGSLSAWFLAVGLAPERVSGTCEAARVPSYWKNECHSPLSPGPVRLGTASGDELLWFPHARGRGGGFCANASWSPHHRRDQGRRPTSAAPASQGRARREHFLSSRPSAARAAWGTRPPLRPAPPSAAPRPPARPWPR